mgnify:CR=1 FL=1
MVYIEEDSEMGQALKDSIDLVGIFENSNDKDYWDLSTEGTGLEAWSEDEDLFDWEEHWERYTVGFKFSLKG